MLLHFTWTLDLALVITVYPRSLDPFYIVAYLLSEMGQYYLNIRLLGHAVLYGISTPRSHEHEYKINIMVVSLTLNKLSGHLLKLHWQSFTFFGEYQLLEKYWK